jgi:hypothetical protein
MYSFISICGLNDRKKLDTYKKILENTVRSSYVY